VHRGLSVTVGRGINFSLPLLTVTVGKKILTTSDKMWTIDTWIFKTILILMRMLEFIKLG